MSFCFYDWSKLQATKFVQGNAIDDHIRSLTLNSAQLPAGWPSSDHWPHEEAKFLYAYRSELPAAQDGRGWFFFVGKGAPYRLIF